MLKLVADASVDTVITSPPYFRLRDYQYLGQIGLEEHVDAWVDELRLVARGLHRVLKPTGSLWLNLGDTYARSVGDGAKPKSLVLAPERVALALQADGWILRNKVVWAKPNPMPSSVRDRLSCSHEVVYFFTKQAEYFFDLDAIRIPHVSQRLPDKQDNRGYCSTRRNENRAPIVGSTNSSWSVPKGWRGPAAGSNSGLSALRSKGLSGHPLGKNPGDVWSIPTAGYRGAHHAVFPERLVERPLLATCPEKVCFACGVPWTRLPAKTKVMCELTRQCSCTPSETKPGTVLDPFFGAGTTGLVAEKHGRQWIGIELNPEFAELANQRVEGSRVRPETRETP
jgi:site-specific DNA-methyltransferase (adenine-specific)